MDSETIRARLRRLRKAANLTQDDLAAKAKVSQGTIGNLESGLRRYGESIVDIAAALGVTPDYLRCATDVADDSGGRPLVNSRKAHASHPGSDVRVALELVRDRLALLPAHDQVQVIASLKFFLENPGTIESAIVALERPVTAIALGESPSEAQRKVAKG